MLHTSFRQHKSKQKTTHTGASAQDVQEVAILQRHRCSLRRVLQSNFKAFLLQFAVRQRERPGGPEPNEEAQAGIATGFLAFKRLFKTPAMDIDAEEDVLTQSIHLSFRQPHGADRNIFLNYLRQPHTFGSKYLVGDDPDKVFDDLQATFVTSDQFAQRLPWLTVDYFVQLTKKAYYSAQRLDPLRLNQLMQTLIGSSFEDMLARQIRLGSTVDCAWNFVKLSTLRRYSGFGYLFLVFWLKMHPDLFETAATMGEDEYDKFVLYVFCVHMLADTNQACFSARDLASDTVSTDSIAPLLTTFLSAINVYELSSDASRHVDSDPDADSSGDEYQDEVFEQKESKARQDGQRQRVFQLRTPSYLEGAVNAVTYCVRLLAALYQSETGLSLSSLPFSWLLAHLHSKQGIFRGFKHVIQRVSPVQRTWDVENADFLGVTVRIGNDTKPVTGLMVGTWVMQLGASVRAGLRGLLVALVNEEALAENPSFGDVEAAIILACFDILPVSERRMSDLDFLQGFGWQNTLAAERLSPPDENLKCRLDTLLSSLRGLLQQDDTRVRELYVSILSEIYLSFGPVPRAHEFKGVCVCVCTLFL